MIGQTISHYRLDKKLGEGTYGQVFLATHLHDPAMQVAIKVVHNNLSNDPDFVAGLRRECLVLARLTHQHIVSYRDLVLSDTHPPAMVLELLDGADLHAVCQRGPMAIAQVVRVVEAMLSGLGWAHNKGVVHRDIKPSNVMLCADGEVKLLDFGIARAADASKATKTGVIQGTLDYVAPEVVFGAKATSAADIYATGLVAWELLVGRAACPGGSLGAKCGWHMGVALTDVRIERTDCPDWLAELVNTLSAKDLEVRPGDGAAALVALRAAVPVGGVVEPKRVVVEVPKGPGTVTLNRADIAAAVSEPLVQRPPSAGPNTVALPVAKVAEAVASAAAPVRTAPPPKSSKASKSSMNRTVAVLVGFAVVGFLALAAIGGLIYMATDGGQASPKVSKNAKASKTPNAPTAEPYTNSLDMKFEVIKAGTFTMGSPFLEKGRGSDETPHTVKLTRSFWMGATEVTQGQYKALMRSNPSHFASCGDDCPVEKVSWLDAVKFANALSKKEGWPEVYTISGDSVGWPDKSATGYRLPTEAEWEYAARAGGDTIYAGGDDIDAVAWWAGNSGDKTRPVHGLKKNAWDLYDMSGNVWEWCWDWYISSASGESIDPVGDSTGSGRVLRGGSWYGPAAGARVALRYSNRPVRRNNFLGFRLVRTIP